jgi:hypothetical protein
MSPALSSKLDIPALKYYRTVFLEYLRKNTITPLVASVLAEDEPGDPEIRHRNANHSTATWNKRSNASYVHRDLRKRRV